MMEQLLERDGAQEPAILAEINIEHIDDDDVDDDGENEQHDSQVCCAEMN